MRSPTERNTVQFAAFYIRLNCRGVTVLLVMTSSVAKFPTTEALDIDHREPPCPLLCGAGFPLFLLESFCNYNSKPSRLSILLWMLPLLWNKLIIYDLLPCEVVVNIETRFISDPNVNIDVLDIPVNAVATALKDFFSKRLPPLFEADLMTELEDIAGKWLYNSNEKNSPLTCSGFLFL